jgi:hypothetical protein
VAVRFRSICDPDLGAIVEAVGDDGRVLASGASSPDRRLTVIYDEGAMYAETGQLLPANLWDACVDDGP